LSKFDEAMTASRQTSKRAHRAYQNAGGAKDIAEKQKALDAIDVLLGQMEAKRAEMGEMVKAFDLR